MVVEYIERYLGGEKRLDEKILSDMIPFFFYKLKRQFMTEKGDSKGKFYPSYAGKCARQVWYKFHGELSPRVLEPRTQMKFFFGDVIEGAIITLMKLCFGGQLNTDTDKCKVEVDYGDGKKYNGYIDGDFVSNEGKKLVLEIKSMTDMSFSRFCSEGITDDWGYLTQHNQYLKYKGYSQGIFVAVNTNTGHFAERVVSYDEQYWNKAVRCYGLATKEELPPQDHKPITKFIRVAPDGFLTPIEKPPDKPTKGYDYPQVQMLVFQCSYCDFVEKCYPDFKVEFSSSNKPFYINRR